MEMVGGASLRGELYGYPKERSHRTGDVPVFSRTENDMTSASAENPAPSKENAAGGGYIKCSVKTSDGKSGVLYHGKDIIASIGGAGGTVNVKYHECSTEEDPVVITWGTDAKGKEYETFIHLNDIDINHATPAEMMALNAHLAKAGYKDVSAAGPIALWNSLGQGNDVNSKMDFEQYYKGHIAMQQLADKSGAALYQYELERYLFFTRQTK